MFPLSDSHPRLKIFPQEPDVEMFAAIFNETHYSTYTTEEIVCWYCIFAV